MMLRAGASVVVVASMAVTGAGASCATAKPRRPSSRMTGTLRFMAGIFRMGTGAPLKPRSLPSSA